MFPLDNPIQPYAWGSRTAISELQRRPSPSAVPEAELWMGAHPAAPSKVLNHGKWQSLIDLIDSEPEAMLGAPVVSRFGPSLPFLLKVLAADQPLSLQAHPSIEQATSGFDREEAAAIASTAQHRNFKDRNHKPELLCALTSFEVLCGFRPVTDTLHLFGELDVRALMPYLEPLHLEPANRGLRATLSMLMSATESEKRALVDEVVEASARALEAGSAFRNELRWTQRLADSYPGDVGVIVALLLQWLRLDPDQGLFLPSGILHAYLQGVGIEVMANSDNVLRGGLTPKHVDVSELMRILKFADTRASLTLPRQQSPGQYIYDTGAAEFSLGRIIAAPGQAQALAIRGPEILLCTSGMVTARDAAGQSLVLQSGQSAFIPASARSVMLEGEGEVFRATVGA